MVLEDTPLRDRTGWHPQLLGGHLTRDMIGERIGVTGARVGQLFNMYGLNQLFLDRGAAYVQAVVSEEEHTEQRFKQLRADLLVGLRELRDSRSDDPAWSLVHRVCDVSRRVEKPLSAVHGLMHDYLVASEQGREVSFADLGRPHGLNSRLARRYLAKAGKESLVRTLPPFRRPDWRPDAVKRTKPFPVSAADVAHWVGYTGPTNVNYHWRKANSERPDEILLSGSDGLTARLASQIYHAQHLGFSQTDIQDTLDVPLQVYRRALAERSCIEPVLRDVLSAITLTDVPTPFLEGPIDAYFAD